MATAAARSAVAGEQTRDARLVVVLQEADEPRLVGELGAQVTAHAHHVPADDPVIEPLVVAEVEALLLKRPFHIPVGLGDEHGLRVLAAQARDDGRPELPPPRAPGQYGHPRSWRRPDWSSAWPCRSGSRRTARRCPTASARSPRAGRGENASSCTTSGHGGKYGSRPWARMCPAARTQAAGSASMSASPPLTSNSGWVVTQGWSGATWLGT